MGSLTEYRACTSANPHLVQLQGPDRVQKSNWRASAEVTLLQCWRCHRSELGSGLRGSTTNGGRFEVLVVNMCGCDVKMAAYKPGMDRQRWKNMSGGGGLGGGTTNLVATAGSASDSDTTGPAPVMHKVYGSATSNTLSLMTSNKLSSIACDTVSQSC